VGAPAGTTMSDWKTVEVFQARSGAQYSAFAVGMAIAGLGNRKDGGWTYASIARIALLARVDPKSAHRAINELADSGELEYLPGTSRHNPSRYRIRTEILNTGVDRFRCALTMDKSSMVTMDKLSTVTRDDLSADHGQIDAHPGQIDHATMENLSTPSVNRSVNRSIDQISDQSDDPAKSWVRTEADDIALKASFKACRRAVDTSAGEG
jgi:hypothetical protein